MQKREQLDILLDRTRGILSGSGAPFERLQKVCEMLRTAGLTYDWVGYYLVSRDERGILELGPFAGEPTDHVRIPFGHGICGQAADRGVTLVIADVSKETNYLSCSSSVKTRCTPIENLLANLT